MKTMKLTYFLVATLISQLVEGQILHGTSIFYTIAYNQLYIASDSKINFSDNDTTSERECKIHHYDNYTWAATGIYEVPGLFSLKSVIEMNYKQYKNIPFENFQALLNNSIKSRFDFALNFINDTIRKNFIDTGGAIILFSSSYKGDKILFQETVFYDSLINGRWRMFDSVRYSEKDIASESVPFFHAIGFFDSSATIYNRWMETDDPTFIFKDPNFNVNGDKKFDLSPIQNLVYYFIYVETKHSPKVVAEPITVLGLRANGWYHWFYNELNCP